MNKERSLPFLQPVIGLFVILLLAVVGDHIVWYLDWQIRHGDFSSYGAINFWVRSFSLLLVGMASVLVLYLLLKVPGNRLIGWLFLLVGALIIFYPQMYLSTALWNLIGYNNPLDWLLGYFANYHSIVSLLYHPGGTLAAVGLFYCSSRDRLNRTLKNIPALRKVLLYMMHPAI